jgi:multicomponent Na+:H+ antiporter subunit F
MTLFSTLLLWVVLPMLLAGAVLAFVRLVLGPSLPDRVVALELMTMAGIGIVAVYAVLTEQTSLLDVALILALIGFLSTVAFATYVQRNVT